MSKFEAALSVYPPASVVLSVLRNLSKVHTLNVFRVIS